MGLLTRARSWLKWIVKRSELESALETEVRFHIRSHAEDLVRSGLPEAEAMRRAPIVFGGIEAPKDAIRGAHGSRRGGRLLGDLPHALRNLRRSPRLSL